jgi:hypothetical protein
MVESVLRQYPDLANAVGMQISIHQRGIFTEPDQMGKGLEEVFP